MGDLIRFRPRDGARPISGVAAEAMSERDGGATILLFTGVRYERHDEKAATAPKLATRNTPAKGGGPRKRA